MRKSQRVSRGFHRLGLFVAVGLSFVLVVKAAAQVPAYLNGNKLLQLCEAEDKEARAVCRVYIQGVVDELRFVVF
jgi:hypothetical protein